MTLLSVGGGVRAGSANTLGTVSLAGVKPLSMASALSNGVVAVKLIGVLTAAGSRPKSSAVGCGRLWVCGVMEKYCEILRVLPGFYVEL